MVSKKEKKRITPEEASKQPGFVKGDANEPVGFLPSKEKGRGFVLPPSELRNLERQGDLEPGETLKEQRVLTQQKKIEANPQLAEPVQTAKDIPILSGRAPDEEPNLASKIPLLGEVTTAGEETARAARQTDLLRKIQSGEATSEEMRIATGRFQLDEIDIEIIKAGEADISKTAQFVEGLPFIPSKVKRFLSAFTSPSSKVNDIKENISKIGDNIGLWSQLAASNPARASQYIKLIEDAEVQLTRMNSRLKLMTIQSPDLRSNPEEIASMQADITTVLSSAQANRDALILQGIR